MSLVQYQVEKWYLLELLDFIPEFLIADDNNIVVIGGSLDYFGFFLRRSFIYSDTDAIEIFSDFVPPIISD